MTDHDATLAALFQDTEVTEAVAYWASCRITGERRDDTNQYFIERMEYLFLRAKQRAARADIRDELESA